MAKAIKIDQASLKRVLGNIQRVGDRATKQATAALFLEAQEILTRSRQEFVPVSPGAKVRKGGAPGTLRADSGVTNPTRSRNPQVAIWYGAGPAKAYALAVHEHPSSHSPPSWKGKSINWNVGGPKYLERPLLEAVGGMAARIARNVKL